VRLKWQHGVSLFHQMGYEYKTVDLK
jgi:hypothetical protein